MRVSTPYDHITEKVIAAAYRVHSVLKSGYAEKVYQAALCIELQAEGLKFECQKSMRVHYSGHVVGEFVADLVVEGVVLLELKAVHEGFTDEHKAQIINYLTCLQIPIGLLINFGKKVDLKRFMNRTLLPPTPSNASDSSV